MGGQLQYYTDMQLAREVRCCNHNLNRLNPQLDVVLLKRRPSARDGSVMLQVSYWMDRRNEFAEEMRSRNLVVPDDFVR